MLTKLILFIFEYLKKIILKTDFESGLIGAKYIFITPYLVICCQCLQITVPRQLCFNIVQNYLLEAILNAKTKMRIPPYRRTMPDDVTGRLGRKKRQRETYPVNFANPWPFPVPYKFSTIQLPLANHYILIDHLDGDRIISNN